MNVALATRKTLMNFNRHNWIRFDSMNCFDISVGSLNSDQVNDLVGLYLLFQTKDSFPNLWVI